MGYALSWLAFKGESKNSTLDKMNLISTREFEELPEAEICGVELGTWFVILGNDPYDEELIETDLKTVSKNCEVIFCNVEEHVMFSYAEFWRNGQQICVVSHDAQKGVENLEEAGKFPEQYESIKSRLLEEQKTSDDRNYVDYVMDIPISLVESVTGFRHDKDIEGRDKPFETLNRDPRSNEIINGKIKAWFKKLFSK